MSSLQQHIVIDKCQDNYYMNQNQLRGSLAETDIYLSKKKPDKRSTEP